MHGFAAYIYIYAAHLLLDLCLFQTIVINHWPRYKMAPRPRPLVREGCVSLAVGTCVWNGNRSSDTCERPSFSPGHVIIVHNSPPHAFPPPPPGAARGAEVFPLLVYNPQACAALLQS